MHYNYFIPAEAIPMQNVNNLTGFTDFPPFYYISNQLPYYTFIPITPSLTQTSSPNQDHPLNYANFVFPTQLDHQFYYAPQTLQYEVPSIPSQSQQPRATGMLQSVLPRNQNEVQTCSSLTAIQRLDRNEQPQAVRTDGCQVMMERKQNQMMRSTRSKKEDQEQKQDREYLPQWQRKKRGTVKYQENQNRNIVPNQINQIFSFIQKPAKSGALLERVLRKYPHPPQYNAKRYYQYQTLLKNKLGHYTNERSLKLVTELYQPKCESWAEQEQRYYNTISRVLIRHFLYQDSVFIILTSKRMKREKKSDHLRARRQISQMVLRVLRGL